MPQPPTIVSEKGVRGAGRRGKAATLVPSAVVGAICLAFATGAQAVIIGDKPINFPKPQFESALAAYIPVFNPGGCSFSDPVTTPKNCTNADGTFTVNGAGVFMYTLSNMQNDKATKTLLLTIELSAATGADFVPTPNSRPGVSAAYSLRDPQKAKVTFTAESWVPATNTLQFEWTIFPQPAAETVLFPMTFMEGIKNAKGVVTQTPFDMTWVLKMSLMSHCPEPDTWTMLVVGVGLAGGSLRRRRAAMA